jgi:probable rRNA maturation factor
MIDVDITTNNTAWESALPNLIILTEKTVQAALSRVPALQSRALEVSIVFDNDTAVQELNKTYRFKDKPTNVLSFPQIEWSEALPDDPMLPLGDIILAFETVEREAQEQNKSLNDHTCHLLVHGTLHLCGYDHEDDDEAEIMEALEVEVLAELGIKNPY